MKQKRCLTCNKVIKKSPKLSYKQFYSQKFCCKKCVAVKLAFKKGHKPWNTGLTAEKQPNYGRRWAKAENRELHVGRRYEKWRKAVFERDNYTCLICKKRGGKLNAHHIYGFKKFPKLRYVIANGATVCEDCHRNKLCVCKSFRGKHKIGRLGCGKGLTSDINRSKV